MISTFRTKALSLTLVVPLLSLFGANSIADSSSKEVIMEQGWDSDALHGYRSTGQGSLILPYD